MMQSLCEACDFHVLAHSFFEKGIVTLFALRFVCFRLKDLFEFDLIGIKIAQS